jgi:hypothetical protein
MEEVSLFVFELDFESPMWTVESALFNMATQVEAYLGMPYQDRPTIVELSWFAAHVVAINVSRKSILH